MDTRRFDEATRNLRMTLSRFAHAAQVFKAGVIQAKTATPSAPRRKVLVGIWGAIRQPEKAYPARINFIDALKERIKGARR